MSKRLVGNTGCYNTKSLHGIQFNHGNEWSLVQQQLSMKRTTGRVDPASNHDPIAAKDHQRMTLTSPMIKRQQRHTASFGIASTLPSGVKTRDVCHPALAATITGEVGRLIAEQASGTERMITTAAIPRNIKELTTLRLRYKVVHFVRSNRHPLILFKQRE